MPFFRSNLSNTNLQVNEIYDMETSEDNKKKLANGAGHFCSKPISTSRVFIVGQPVLLKRLTSTTSDNADAVTENHEFNPGLRGLTISGVNETKNDNLLTAISDSECIFSFVEPKKHHLKHKTKETIDGVMGMEEDVVQNQLVVGDDYPMNDSHTSVTIQSLSSNAIIVFPETHRNQSTKGMISDRSSGDNAPVYPTSDQKSKLSKKRRKRRSKTGSTQRSERFYQSLPDDDESICCHYSKTTSKEEQLQFRSPKVITPEAVNSERDNTSDVGRGSYTPRSSISTVFPDHELRRPDTASSEILAEGALASVDECQHRMIVCLLDIHDEDEEDWYVDDSVDGREENSVKIKLRHLTKMFYRREESISKYGPLFTYKLMLGGLHNRLEDFVLLSVPPAFNVKSRITRLKKGFVDRRLYPIYYMHLERDGPGDRKCLVLIAKKYKNLTGTGYILSTDPAELSTSSEYCVGRVESNFIGTEFILFSGRSVCTDVPPEKGALMAVPKSDRFKEELASIIYDPNVLGFKGPRRVKVILPQMKNFLERKVVRPRINEETLISQFKNQEDSVIVLKNKDPIWSKETHSYILNFAGRVTTPSVKNFQIVSTKNEEHIMLQFGRASENTFSLDFRYPFSPLQAFAIALSSFESKLACE